MQAGIHVSRFTWPDAPASIGPTLARIARDAEDAGVVELSVMDHFFQIPIFAETDTPEREPMLESGTALAWIAAQTNRMRLGALVTGVVYRHPGALIKAVTTLDVLSGGRAFLGIGAAWNDREARGLGLPFPPMRERFERLEEVLQIAHHMWSGNTEPYIGKHYRLEEPINEPGPISRPHPPIMIGGNGEQKTLRMVAQYGDACNLLTTDLDTLKHKLDVLRRHCDELGRPYEEITRTLTTSLRLGDGTNGTETPDQALARLQAYADLGIDLVSFDLPNIHDPETIERFGREIVSSMSGMTPVPREESAA